jgi:hypothetical protein
MLLSHAAAQMILVNDMYSYRRETLWLEDITQKKQKLDSQNATGDLRNRQEYYVFNAVCILLRGKGVDETNVMEKLGTHIRRTESDFMTTAEKLRVRYSNCDEDADAVQNWCMFLMEGMAGNYYWSTVCRRYNTST